MIDNFHTLALPAEGYYMDKNSRFLAFAYPVADEDEAHEKITALKKLHHKANHFCTGLRLGPEAELERSSDDGEPSGSAGKPIINQIIRYNLTYTLVVVVRYFGGTKLGVPGLIEAYRESTMDALRKAVVVSMNVYIPIKITLNFDLYAPFKNLIMEKGFPVLEEFFVEKATIRTGILKSKVHQDLIKLLRTFSQRDFSDLKEYLTFLDIQIEIEPKPVFLKNKS